LTQDKKLNREAFSRRYYSEREISEIVWFVGSKHLQNVTNIGLNI